MRFPLAFFLAVLALAPGCSADKPARPGLHVVDHEPYVQLVYGRPTMAAGPHTHFVSHSGSLMTFPSFELRAPNESGPGDYFWSPDAFSLQEQKGHYFIYGLTNDGRRTVAQFLEEYFPAKFSDSLIVNAIRGYCYNFTNGGRLENYLMLADGDTVYVLSGWLGKFKSLFRAVPNRKKLTKEEFISQVRQFSSILDDVEIADSLFAMEDDSRYDRQDFDFYFMEYFYRRHGIWLRNYPARLRLPPSSPQRGLGRVYNIIEITRIEDNGMFIEMQHYARRLRDKGE
jgi:hypothetical protein